MSTMDALHPSTMGLVWSAMSTRSGPAWERRPPLLCSAGFHPRIDGPAADLKNGGPRYPISIQWESSRNPVVNS
jgi:hypothetical protein